MKNCILRTLFVLGAVVGVTTAAAAQTSLAVTGKWTGTFEFIVLGQKAGLGPAAVFNQNLRGIEGEPARLGEGTLDVHVVNQAGNHFFGRWTVNGQSSEFVCTLRDDSSFLCGGRRTNVVGSVESDDRLQMCWSASGPNATSGCAELTRPG